MTSTHRRTTFPTVTLNPVPLLYSPRRRSAIRERLAQASLDWWWIHGSPPPRSPPSPAMIADRQERVHTIIWTPDEIQDEEEVLWPR